MAANVRNVGEFRHMWLKRRVVPRATPRKQNGDSAPEPRAPPEPPRITSNSLIPVRRQIKWVRQYKEEVRKQAFRAPKKERLKEAYRKDTPTEEERVEQKRLREAEELELSKTESKNFALRSLYQTSPVGLNARKQALRATRSVPILLVDGYNVVFKWSLTADLMADGELEDAREVLVSHLEDYSTASLVDARRSCHVRSTLDARVTYARRSTLVSRSLTARLASLARSPGRWNGIRVVVAFDAMGNENSPGTSESLLASGVTVVFTGDREADTFISAQAKEWVNRGAKTVVVVTDDIVLRVATQSSEGQRTVTVPVSGLIADMTATRKRAQAGMSTGAPVLNLLECAVKEKDTVRGNDTLDKLQALRNSLLPDQQRRT